jgi:alkylation response protein AidB-like acyl-CoA dehydrogenase
VDREQRDLRDAVRGLLARGGGWKGLCAQIGVAGLVIPQRYGGAGAGLAEAGIVLAELGRELTGSPMLGSAALAASAVLASGDEAACERLLPPIADGTVAALAWTTQAGRWEPSEVAFTGGLTGGLTGQAHYVLDGDTAQILLAATSEGLVEVDLDGPGVSRSPAATLDQTRRLAVVRLEGARGRRIGGGDAVPALAAARDAACVAIAAEAAGAAERALELTVSYTKDRVQFGRPIGAFQALQHRMADMHVLVESARSLWCAAAAGADTAADAGPMLAAAAKVYCCDALTTVAAEMIQLHGAMGVTWEHPAHLYFKRAHGAALLFGSPERHAARIAASVLGR